MTTKPAVIKIQCVVVKAGNKKFKATWKKIDGKWIFSDHDPEFDWAASLAQHEVTTRLQATPGLEFYWKRMIRKPAQEAIPA